jgi:hypothetical protein
MVRRNLGVGPGSWCHCVAIRRNLNFRSRRECRDLSLAVPGLDG